MYRGAEVIKSTRIDLTIITVSAVLAVLAIVTPIIRVGGPIQFLAVLGGILLGPGGLAYRLATGSSWGQCLMVGLALNIAALAMLALAIIAVHFWHPKVELIIPAVTCLLAVVLYRRHGQVDYRHNAYPRGSRAQVR
jgi:hypothetical protein